MDVSKDGRKLLRKKLKEQVLADFEATNAFAQSCEESGQLLKKDKRTREACLKQLKASKVELTRVTELADLPKEERAAFEKVLSDGLWKILNSRDFSEKFQEELRKVVRNAAESDI